MYTQNVGTKLVTSLPTAAGVVVLPNTGGNRLLMAVSILSIVTGGVIMLSTLARFVAKNAYKA